MSIKSKDDLLTGINTDLANNTAGLISAQDVRRNMVHIVDSINSVVGSGDHDTVHPFMHTVQSSGLFVSMSGGFRFPDGTTQATAVIESSIDHGSIAGLSDDDHAQYLLVDGTRAMTSHLKLGTSFLNNDGGDNEGVTVDTYGNVGVSGALEVGGDLTVHGSGVFDGTLSSQTITLGDGTSIGTTKSMAKAWVNFDGSTSSPTVNTSYNVSSVVKVDTGKFHINLTAGVLNDNNFVAIGNSNGRSDNDTREDFDRNTVGLVLRDYSVGSGVSFSVLNENGSYTGAKVNDLVIFGEGP